jgi:hypothetical protein
MLSAKLPQVGLRYLVIPAVRIALGVALEN